MTRQQFQLRVAEVYNRLHKVPLWSESKNDTRIVKAFIRRNNAVVNTQRKAEQVAATARQTQRALKAAIKAIQGALRDNEANEQPINDIAN